MSPEGGWLQLTLDGVHPALAEAALEAEGALAVTLLDGADELLVEPAPGAGPLWQQTRVVGLFAAESDEASISAALCANFGTSPPRIESKLVEDRDWIRAWMDHYKPMCFGDRLWVCPRGQQIDSGDTPVVYLDPGLAFGTGTHPTTSLCLEYLAAETTSGLEVIDYGCGSGILAIAALKLGAARARFFDIDPQAMKATLQNGRDNAVADRLEVLDLDYRAPAADLLLANILAGPLIELAPELGSMLRHGGRLVLSGLLERQEEEVMAAYADQFEFSASARLDGWSRLSATRIAS